MKISLNWLSDWVDLTGLEPEELAERLTLGTAEVEGFEVVRNAAGHAVVARVVAVEPLGASGPWAVTVDTGGARHVTVTTATGLTEGTLVAYAPVGAPLPGGRLAVAVVAGRESHGMLCAPGDLGLAPMSDVLLRCPPDAEVGTALSAWVPERDVLVEIDNKSLTHRPDLWGHYGFAREFAAVLSRPLRELDTADLAGFSALPEVAVANDGGGDCPCVTALAVDVDNTVPAPLTVQTRLVLLGQRPVNLMVDLTNYVMLETGQPTHAYDRDSVAGLRVAPAGERAGLRTLDGQDRRLTPEDLLIWSGDEPVGLAGIMGGAESGVRAATGRILLESANFRASRVRRTAMRLGLRTDASQRFEKSQPPSSTRTATARLVHLLERSGTRHEVVSRFTVAGDLREQPRTVELAADHVRRVAGAPIPDTEVDAILTRLGFTVDRDADRLRVGVPAFRAAQDIGIPADIVEEVLRVHGYAAIEPRPPAASLAPVPPNPAIRREHKARRILAGGHGFVEVQTYLWTDDRWLARLGCDPGETPRLRNPVAPEKARLRTTLVPNVLAVVNENLDAAEEFAVFEIGRVVLAGLDDGDGTHREVSRLAGASVCPAKPVPVRSHYRRVKGALEDVVAAIGDGSLRVEPETVAGGAAPWHVPDVTGRLHDGSGPVGTAGILLGPVLDTVAPTRQVVWFELELDRLGGPLYPAVAYRPVPVYPESQQDFSILWPVARTYAGLERTLDEFTHPLVHAREFVLDYQGKGLPPDTGSYTFRYRLVHPERTLTGEDLAMFRAAFLEFLDERGLALR